MASPRNTLSLEEMLRLGAHHLEALVDEKGRTYFDIFLTNPAEAVTDWPDFIDLPARYWEALAMADPVFLRNEEITQRIRRWLFSHFEEDGLAYRPEGSISAHIPEMFDQSRLLYALVSWAMFDPADMEVRQRTIALVEQLKAMATFEGDYAYIEKIGIYFGGTLIRPILQAGLILERPDWVDFAGGLARGLIHHSELIESDGSFTGHVHGALSAIAGAIAYAVLTGDDALLARARSGFDYARSISTSFGFVPELAKRDDDLIACETCTLMDYLDAALLLARHVDAGYWDVIEKAIRNHLWESQIRDASWLPSSDDAHDEENIIRSGLPKKILGAFAGWSAPHCLLAYHEYLDQNWVRTPGVKPMYLNKIRAVQNCCAGGGVRAVHQVWSNIVTREGDIISINVSMDKSTDELDITSYLPFSGDLLIRMKKDASLRWRIPASIDLADITVNGTPAIDFPLDNGFLILGLQTSGTEIAIQFPLDEHTESVTIGNEGFAQYRFDVTWRGDTVTSIIPDPTNASTGYTRVMKCQTPTCFAHSGIGPIYQRRDWPRSRDGIAPADRKVDRTGIDWYSLPTQHMCFRSSTP